MVRYKDAYEIEMRLRSEIDRLRVIEMKLYNRIDELEKKLDAVYGVGYWDIGR